MRICRFGTEAQELYIYIYRNYSTLLQSYSERRHCVKAPSLLVRVQHQDSQHDVVTYSTLTKACSESWPFSKALHLLLGIKQHLQLIVVSSSILMKAGSDGRQ